MRMRLAGYVASIGMKRHAYMLHLDNLKERDSFKDISVDGKTILKWIPRKQNGIVETQLIRLR